jgi:hypothetical protein
MNQKQELGQFMTTNQQYILQEMYIPKHITHIIEPFVGKGDLLKFVEKYSHIEKIDCYDIDPKCEAINQDTLLNSPKYANSFIITNPPYLARNKSKLKNKDIFDKYNTNDLYKCFIKEIITNYALGGILIIPLNFWSSIRILDIKLREAFLNRYNIVLMNIFEEQVFDDTSYTICSFQFELKQSNQASNPIKIIVYPTKLEILANLNKSNGFLIGGNIYNLPLSMPEKYNITRLTTKNTNLDEKYKTHIVVKCIDDNANSKICLKYVKKEQIYIDNTPNQSARTYATLVINPAINLATQKLIVSRFNTLFNAYRNKYHSLFLTNYRESKDIARKRISFDLVYRIVKYLLEHMETSELCD